MKDRALLSKAKYVMKVLVARSPQGSSYVEVSRMHRQELDSLFEAAYMSLCSQIYPETTVEMLDGKRVGDRSYLTIYDHAKKV